MNIFKKLDTFTKKDDGLTMIEYAVAGAVISGATFFAFQGLAIAIVDNAILILYSIVGGIAH